MAYFVVEFPLRTEKWQEDILNTRLEVGRHIYNSLIHVTQNRYKEMIKTKEYRLLKESLTGDKKKEKQVWREIGELRKRYGLTEYDFHKDVKKMQKHYKRNIDSHTAQKIASQVWKSYETLFYGNGNKVYYKKYGTFHSLEGKTNKSGIRLKEDILVWNGLKIPVVIDDNNLYEYEAMQSEICYCRIVRRYVRTKYKYYVQLICKGNPPIKWDQITGKVKHRIGEGDVGIDIGTSTIAISSKKEVKLLELASDVQSIEKEKRILLRKMERSRRAMNPDHYEEDGTIKKQGNKKVIWKKSNHYIKCQKKLRELYRKQSAVRKYQHECLANHIVSLGDCIYVEEMNFSGLQKRRIKTEKNEKGRYKRKKRFGKSIANRAPAMLLSILDRKLSYHGLQLIKINTRKARASQFHHFDGTYQKKSLSQRWNYFDDIKIQRDMYSAFLIMNIRNDLESFDIEKCEQTFDNFKMLHDKEVERLKGHKNLSSIAI